MAARIRKGDKVVVRSGKDAGKTGTVLQVFAETDKVLVEGVNVVKKSVRAQNGEGGGFSKELPLHASKVMPIDPETGKGTRVRFKADESGKKVRVAVKSGKEIPAVRETK
jgi:large subunit ribosomal protein L24